MHALDTNTLIYFFKGLGRVGERLLSTPPSEIAIPSVVLYELEYGLARSNAPAKRREQLERLLSVVRILPFDAEAARFSGAVRASLERAGTPIGPHDTLIAGTALAFDAVLVTRNTAEFGRVERLRVVDWY